MLTVQEAQHKAIDDEKFSPAKELLAKRKSEILQKLLNDMVKARKELESFSNPDENENVIPCVGQRCLPIETEMLGCKDMKQEVALVEACEQDMTTMIKKMQVKS